MSTFALAVLPPHAPATLADEEGSRPSAINAVNFSSLTGSPDPRCTVRLPAIRTLWMTDALPIFFDAGQLAASPWKDYVTLVYGEPEFPIDMRSLFHVLLEGPPAGSGALAVRVALQGARPAGP